MRLRRLRGPAILMLALHVQACVTWRPSMVEPRQLLGQEMPASIRVQTVDGREVVARSPRIVRDTIVGGVETCRPDHYSQTGASCEVRDMPVAALADIQRIEVRRVDAGRTVLGVLGTSALLAGVFVLILAANYEFSWGNG